LAIKLSNFFSAEAGLNRPVAQDEIGSFGGAAIAQ
jgi:hypothetical protein